jgi:hypothetical protein
MKRKVRVRFWVESALALVAVFLFVLTVVSREWIEELFGVEPDAGSGALEWAIVAAFAVAAVTFGLLARAEWNRSPAVT